MPTRPSPRPAAFDPDAAASPGSGIFGLPHTIEESRVVVVPVPCEATTSYRAGTAKGPAAVFAASRQVDLHDRQTGAPYTQGIAMEPIPGPIARRDREARRLALPILAAGGVIKSATQRQALAKVNRCGEEMNAWVHARTAALLASGKLPVILGGDHSVAFGAIQSCAERHPGLGILHIDAHADLREAYEGFTWSHASIMFNVVTRIPAVARLVQVGLRDVGRSEQQRIRGASGRIVAFHDADVALDLAGGKSFTAIAAAIVRELPESVYISWDIDGLDPALCPSTGTPVPGGLSWHQATLLLAALAGSGRRVVGMDLSEVAPSKVAGDEWDANVAARLLYKMIGFALLANDSQPVSRRRISGDAQSV
jgi:agmatinase